MKSTILVARTVLLLFAAAAPLLFAKDGVTLWEKTFHPVEGGGNQWTLAARELADGSTLTAVFDRGGVTALQFDHAGDLLGTASFYPIYAEVVIAAVDPFGAVFLASPTSQGFGSGSDVWLMKYDGLTGAALWPAAVYFGYGNHANDTPLALFLDPAGSVILLASTDNGATGVLTKYDGLNGQAIWGPVVASSGGAAPVAAVDPAGDAFVARGGSGFSLTKYAGSNGSIVWQNVESGHALSPVSLGFDGSRNVLVSGTDGSFAGTFEADRYSGSTGARIWGPAIWTPPAGNYSTRPELAAVGSDGSVVIAGHTTANSQSSELLLKFRGADGELLWGPLAIGDPSDQVQSTALVLGGNGDAILNARFQTGESTQDSKLWRFDAGTGSTLWGPQTTVNGSVGAVFVASNGRVFVGSAVFNGADDDSVILERDGATGAPAWGPITFDGVAASASLLWDVTASPDGNAIVTGEVLGPEGNSVWATLKYDRATGSVLWGPAYFPTGNFPLADSPWRVQTDAAGDVLVGGGTEGGMSVVKYSGATGAQLWAATVAPEGFATGFALDPDGNAVITGYGNGSADVAVTTKLAGTDGATLWGPVTYDSGSGTYPDFVATDPSGDVIVAGHSAGVGPPGFVIKYAAADGAVSWGPVAQDDLPTWIAVDASGDVFRESYSAITSGIVTTKFSGATGAVLWGPITMGQSTGTGVALALDAAGDVFVTGGLYNGSTGDYALLKYRGSDGMLLWGPITYDSGGNEFPYAVAVDGSGNAVVTGYSDAGSGEKRSATLSYDGSTGALRWGPVGRNIARSSVNGLATSGSTVYVGATRGDLGYIVDAIGETLGIVAPPGALPAVSCGQAIDVPLGAVNGTPPYAWSVVSGSLPPGVEIDAAGDVAGTPGQEGVFAFRAQVQDAAMATSSRDFTLAVGPGSDLVPIAVAEDPATCQLTLSVSGSYAGYSWLPDGQTTPTISVSPTEPTPYGVILDDGSSCSVRGAVAIVPTDPACLAPTVASIAPASGPGSGTPVVVAGSKFDAEAALSIGGAPATGVVFDGSSTLAGNTPALPPGTVADVLVVNPDGRYGYLARRFAADFGDVTPANPFYADIMAVLRAGITAGCGGGDYCPTGSVTRAQMAVFLLKAEHGFFYVPPPCAGIFADVACPGAFAVNWIERLANEGITGGCGGGNYCPDAAVTRAQMSAFLLKAEHGSSYVPPPCVGIFGDVPCGAPFADWIERLYDEGITGGCGNGNYCPSSPNTRGQMAVFLVKTFQLP